MKFSKVEARCLSINILSCRLPFTEIACFEMDDKRWSFQNNDNHVLYLWRRSSVQLFTGIIEMKLV